MCGENTPLYFSLILPQKQKTKLLKSLAQRLTLFRLRAIINLALQKEGHFYFKIIHSCYLKK